MPKKFVGRTFSDLHEHELNMDSKLRGVVESSFYKTISIIGEEEISYIRQHMLTKIHGISSSTEGWVHMLAVFNYTIFNLISGEIESDKDLDQHIVNCAYAALHYFINPHDIIPDYTPHIGYLDDFYVIKLFCIEVAKYDASLLVQMDNHLEVVKRDGVFDWIQKR